MDFKIQPIKALYKEYYRLHILTDDPRYNDFVDIEADEFIKLAQIINERVEMDSLNVEVIE